MKTETSFYYFQRNVTLWNLQVFGEISYVDIDNLKEHFESIDIIDDYSIFSYFTLSSNEELVEESYKFYRTYNGSQIYLAISPDFKHYILHIRHR